MEGLLRLGDPGRARRPQLQLVLSRVPGRSQSVGVPVCHGDWASQQQGQEAGDVRAPVGRDLCPTNCSWKGPESGIPRGPHLFPEKHSDPAAQASLQVSGSYPPAPRRLLAHTSKGVFASQSRSLSGFCSAQRDGQVLKGGCGRVGKEFPWKREVLDVSVWDPN